MYIGYTSKSIDRRFSGHVYDVKHEVDNTHLHNAMKKYGIENFLIEEIYQSLDKKHTHKIMEPFFIEQYNTLKNGYNLTKGGEGFTGTHTKETKKLISERTKGKNKGQVAWNTGLTKDKDDRVAQMYQNRKQHITWKENFKKTPEREAKRLKSVVKPVIIDGVEYYSAREACAVIGNIKYTTLIKRIKSKNFPNYNWKVTNLSMS
jgi:group I intron endonuclease